MTATQTDRDRLGVPSREVKHVCVPTVSVGSGLAKKKGGGGVSKESREGSVELCIVTSELCQVDRGNMTRCVTLQR